MDEATPQEAEIGAASRVPGFRPVFRAPMRSRDDAVARWAGVDRGLALGLCGMGGRLQTAPQDLAHALVEVERAHGERMARRVARFAAVPLEAEVWTCDEHGTFHRGVLTGGWWYDDAADARAADLVHVRSCTWTATCDVPAEVIATFRRGGRNFQRITAL